MKAFLYGLGLQFRLDIRSRSLLLTCYIVPLAFFALMGGIFTSVMPQSSGTLIQSMSVFVVAMGAVIGVPPQICEEYSGSIKKVYKANGVPLCAGVITHFISAFIHLLIVCAIIFAVAPVAFGASLPQNIAAYFGLLALYIAVSLSVGCVFGLFGKSPSSLAMYAQIVFLPSILLSGIMFPADMLPDFLRYIGYIFPATAAYGAMTSFAAWQLPVLFCELAAMVALCALRLKFLAKN